jgi:hypothetical protein
MQFRNKPAPALRRPAKKPQFTGFRATELYCGNCKRAVPVVERLLLVLPEGDKYEYLCSQCGASVGDKIVKGESDPILIA